MLPQAAASSSIQAHALHTHPAESRRGLGFRGWGVGLRVQPPGRPRPRRAAVTLGLGFTFGVLNGDAQSESLS